MSARSLVLLAIAALIALGLGWIALRTPVDPAVDQVPSPGVEVADVNAPVADLDLPDSGSTRIDEAIPASTPVAAPARSTQDSAPLARDAQAAFNEFRMRPAESQGKSRVSGTVRGALPIEGARIEFVAQGDQVTFLDRMRSAETDASGHYEIELVAPATYSARLEANGCTTLRKTVTLVAAEDATVDFELPSSAVAGRVFGPDGRPVKYVRVQLSPDDVAGAAHALQSLFAWTDDAGRFAFRGVEGGTYRLATDVMSMAGERYVRNAVPVVALRGIEVGGQSSVEDLEIRLTAGVTVLVTVLSPDGSPASGATVEWMQDFGVVGQATADSAGVARLEGLAPGETRLFARASTGAVRTGKTFDLHARAVVESTIRLQPATVLNVRLEDVKGKWITNSTGTSVTVRDLTDTDQPARKSPFGPLPEGNYEVHVEFRSGKQVQQTVYVSGKEQQLVVREPD